MRRCYPLDFDAGFAYVGCFLFLAVDHLSLANLQFNYVNLIIVAEHHLLADISELIVAFVPLAAIALGQAGFTASVVVFRQLAAHVVGCALEGYRIVVLVLVADHRFRDASREFGNIGFVGLAGLAGFIDCVVVGLI